MSRTPRTVEEVTPEQIEAAKRAYTAVRRVYIEQIEAVRRIWPSIREAYQKYLEELDRALCLFHDVEHPPEGGWSQEERNGMARVLDGYDLTDAEYAARYGTDDEESTR